MSWVDQAAEIILTTADKLIDERSFQPYQRDFGKAVVLAVLRQSADELTALFARQSGKTETMARIIVALLITLPFLANHFPELSAYKKGFWAGVFAPVKDQAATSFERMIEVLDSEVCRELLAESDLYFEEKNKSSRKLSNGSFIRIWSASPGSNIESKTLHIAILEESQDIGFYKVRKSIEPMLTATCGLMVHVGTANQLQSPFFEAIQRNKKLERKNPGRNLHFQYDWKEIVKHNVQYRRFLNRKIEDRGRAWIETDEFKMAYGLEFLMARGMFCSFERFMELERLGQNIPRGPYNDQGLCTLTTPIYIGIDFGKSNDSTVVTALTKLSDHHRVVDWLQLVGDSYDSQFKSIISYIQRFPTVRVVLAESNGVGDPMVDRLKAAVIQGRISCKVEGFWASASSKSDGYKKLKMDLVDANRLLFPADDAARKSIEYESFGIQITELLKEWKGSLLKCHHPDKNDAHDDYPDSLMMAHWAASELTTDELFERFYGNPNQKKLA